MSQSSEHTGGGQSENNDPTSDQARKNNPATTKDSLAAKGKDEPLLAKSQRIDSWCTKIEEPGGHHEVAEDLAQDDSGLSEDFKWTLLHDLLERTEDDDDGSDELEKLLGQWKDIIDSHSPKHQETALHMAIRKGFNKMARQLLAAGAEVNIENDSGESPLHVACNYGNQQLVEVLLEEGADPESVDALGNYPLHSAVQQGFEATVVRRLFGPGGFVINKTDNYANRTPLNKAIYHGCEDVVDILLEGGANLGIRDSGRRTPLITAIEQRQHDTIHKLLTHLHNNPTERDVINIPDAFGMTPLMQLSTDNSVWSSLPFRSTSTMIKNTFDNSVRSITNIEALLRMNPDVNTTDDDGKTALHYAMASLARLMETGTGGPYMDLALKLVNLLSVEQLLHMDKDGETAFDVAFDEGGKSSIPAFEPLLNSLVERLLVEGGSIEEPLCWAVYRLERHTFALTLFQRRFADDIRQDPNREQWAIVEWAVHARMPRVLLTYLRTLGVEGMVSKDDKIDRSIENGRELVKTLSEKARQTSAHLTEGKKQNGERNLTGGGDSSQDGQVLRDMENILDYLYPEKAKKPTNPLDLSKPEESMKSSLKDFRAAIIQSNLVMFRTIQEVLYDDNDFMEHMQNTYERLNQFEYTPGVSFRQSSPTFEEFGGNANQFTWIHLPSTNMVWMEDTVKKILERGMYGWSEDKKVIAFLRSSWTEIPDRTSTSRFMRPRYVVKKADIETKQNAKYVSALEDKPIAVSAIYIPYLYFSTYHQSEGGERVAGTTDPSGDEVRLQDEIKMRQELFKAYENSVIHQPMTLDEFYYQFASDEESVRDRNSRNKDQVVTRYLLHGNVEEQRFWPLLRVGQLWVWTIDEKWLITSTSCATNDTRDNLVIDILEHVRRQVQDDSLRSRPDSATEMSKVIVDYCIGAYDREHEHQGRERSIHEIFSDSIIEIGRKESGIVSLSQYRNDRPRETKLGSDDEDISGMMKVIQSALKVVADQLYLIRDVRDELNILMSIAGHQREVQSTMAGSGVNKDLSSDYVLREIKELVRATVTIQESDIASFQAQIANWQANESVKQGVESVRQGEQAVKQGKIVLVFTLVTVWFLPLSFLSSLFALDVESFLQTPAWAFCVIFIVPLVFLGSAAVYVWKADIRRFVANFWTPAEGLDDEDTEGTSTARFTPSERAPRRRKGIDVEHGRG